MTTSEATYEHHFITNDGDVFKMIQDESGDTFWGYGHREAAEFIDEINRWMIYTGDVTDPDDLFHPETNQVDHMLAYNHDGERFAIVDPASSFIPEDAFPVTRLWI